MGEMQEIEKGLGQDLDLKKDDSGTYVAVVLDEELDPVKCKFNNDGCVELEVSGYEYLFLSSNTLYKLASLVEEAEELYEDESEKG